MNMDMRTYQRVDGPPGEVPALQLVALQQLDMYLRSDLGSGVDDGYEAGGAEVGPALCQYVWVLETAPAELD